MAQSASAIERELKYHLEKWAYVRLLKTCRKQVIERARLVTYFFDSPDLILRESKYGFRIRIKDNKEATITLKYPVKSNAPQVTGYKTRREIEQRIPIQKAMKVIKGQMKISELIARPVAILCRRITKAAVNTLEPLGSMTTHRTLAKVAISNDTLELDRCLLFGKQFYELEVETKSPVKTHDSIKDWLEAQEIPVVPSMQSKLSRFIKAWKTNQ